MNSSIKSFLEKFRNCSLIYKKILRKLLLLFYKIKILSNAFILRKRKILNIKNTTINRSTYIFLLELKGERPIIYPRSHYSQHGDRDRITLIFTLKVSTRFRCSKTRVPGHGTKLELEPLRNQYRLVTTLRYIRHILTRFDRINVGINKKWRRCSRKECVTSIEIKRESRVTKFN